MISTITHFLLTELIWGLTGGIYHTPLSFLLLFILLKLWDHVRFVRALWLSLFFAAGAWIIFMAGIAGIMWLFNVHYLLPEDTYHPFYSYLSASLSFAALITLIQWVQLFILKRFVRVRFWHVFVCILCANVMSAVLVYKLTLAV